MGLALGNALQLEFHESSTLLPELLTELSFTKGLWLSTAADLRHARSRN